jgi:PAS domain S-box-containing protein
MGETKQDVGVTVSLQDRLDMALPANPLSCLQRLAPALISALTVEQAADAFIAEATPALRAGAGVICLLTDDAAHLETVRAWGSPPYMAQPGDRLSLDSSALLAQAASRGELMLEHNEIHSPGSSIKVTASPHVAQIAIPLKIQDRVVGVIGLGFTERSSPALIDPTCIEPIAQMVAPALERAMRYDMERAARQAAEQKLEQRVRESDDQTRDFFGSLTEGFLAYNPQWQVMYANEVACATAQLAPEAFIGQDIWELFPEFVGTPYYDACHQAMNERVPVHREDFWPRYDIWIENHIYPINNGVAVMFRDITERKQLETRLREETESLEILNRLGLCFSAELNLEKLVQDATDGATRVTGAQFGAFFYNVVDPVGESYMLYTISGVPREMFSQFPMPRNTALFAPTFAGERTVRLEDVTRDPNYGKNAPYHGKPSGHLPVVSYLAVPVVSRSGEVLGGLFFGHERPGMFTERHERLVEGLAAQAAIAIDNARLFQAERERSYQLGLAISEVHHRVKNSLQAVAALLEMQIPADESVMPVEAALDSLSQIKTIALVHDLLARDKPIGMVDVGRVLTNLAKLLSQGMRMDDRPLPIQVEAQSLEMPTKSATALALAVNELLTNAAKHNVAAETDGEVTEIELSLTCDGANILVVVRDHGPGFASDFDPAHHAHIGLELVQTLVTHDLRGRILFGNALAEDGLGVEGARIEICVPLSGIAE